MSVYTRKAIEVLKGKIVNFLLVPKDIIDFIYGYGKLKHDKADGFPIVGIIPMIGNNHMAAGTIDRHYFLQDIYMAFA